jgi:hypothetical protein
MEGDMDKATWKHFDCDRCRFVSGMGRGDRRIDIYVCGPWWLVRFGDEVDEYAAIPVGLRDAYVGAVLASEN